MVKANIFIDKRVSNFMARDILFYNETLFMNPEVFDFDYVPEEFLFRKNQLDEIISCLRPAIKKQRPVNCMLSGAPATGKTTSIKKIFEELKGYKDIITVCINSRIYNTTFKVYSEVYRRVFGFTPPATGIPLTELFSRIIKKLTDEKKVLIVALDDAVFLEDCDEVIYQLSRANETYPGVKIGIIAVLSEKEKYIIEEKSASVFRPRLIEYEKYSENEILEIMKIRAKMGFYPHVISDEILEVISEKSSEQDLRFGIELLRQAGLEAESKSEKKILKFHVENAFSKILKTSKTKELGKEELNDAEKAVLKLLGEKEKDSGELYELLNKKIEMSYSSFYRLIEKLEKRKLIEITEKNTGKGRTREIKKA